MIGAFFKRHPVFAVHMVIVLLLLPGLLQRTGVNYLPWTLLYGAALAGTYALLNGRIPPFRWRPFRIDLRWLGWGSAALTVVLAIAHWTWLGHIPLFEAFHQVDDLEVMALRRNASAVPVLVAYGRHMALTGLLPTVILICWHGERKAFWPVALAGTCYALSLLQKSPVITLFVPLWASFLVLGRWRLLTALSTVFVLLLAFLVLVANPQKMEQVVVDAEVKPTTEVVDEGVRRHGLAVDLFISLGKRIFLMPGWTVAAWFEHIPADIPFQGGAAVRPLAGLLGQPYVDLGRQVYDLEFPELAAEGTQGTMASASFMYGWANFGGWGLVGAGLIMGAWLCLVNLLFGNRWRYAICLNLFPLLAASATALPTVLLSHGWLLTLLLFGFIVPHEKDLS